MEQDEIAAQYNQKFNEACDRIRKDIHLDGYKIKSLGFFGKKRLRKSISDFNDCLAYDHEHWPSMFFMAKAYQKLGEHQISLELLEKAFVIEKKNHSIAMEASLEAMHLKQIDKAIFYSKESLERKPNDFALMGNHAMNLLIAKRDTEATIFIDKAISLNPNDQINKNVKKVISEVISGKRKRPTFIKSIS